MSGAATATRSSTDAASHVWMPPMLMPIMPIRFGVDVVARLQHIDEPPQVPDGVVVEGVLHRLVGRRLARPS